MLKQIPEISTLSLASVIVSAHVRNNSVASSDLPQLIGTVHEALSDLVAPRKPVRPDPAVPIAKSIKSAYIVCLEDGKMLKRHLRTAFGLTPDQYRERWGLPSDYPMTAPSYAAMRSSMAKKIGLGKSGKKAKTTV